MLTRSSPGILIVLLALSATSLRAETDLAGQASFLVGVPREAFDQVVGTGYGLEGHAFLAAKGRPIGLRLQASFLVYGSETIVVPFPGTGGRVGAEIVTDNWIGSFAAGPELVARHGRIRPYVTTLVGFSYFATTSSFRGDPSPQAAYTTNFDDWTLRWSVAGGLLVPVGSSLAVDVGVGYVWNDSVSYLAEGDIQDDGRGGAVFVPHHGRAELLQFTIGVAGGF
jgi:hypothetical protein